MNISEEDSKIMKSNLPSEEISLEKIVNLIIRNRSLIFSFVFVFFAISLIYGYSRKKIWEGEFQIVLDTKNSPTKSLLDFSVL